MSEWDFPVIGNFRYHYKETAKEAEEMMDDIGIASQSDVKSAARESVNIKWQGYKTM